MDSKTAQRIESNRLVKAAKAESKKTLSGPAMVETALDYRAELAREVLPSPAGGQGVITHATPHVEGAAKALTGNPPSELCTPQQARAMGWLDGVPILPLTPSAPPADVTALLEKRRAYDTYFERICDVFKRFLKEGKDPDADDLDILREMYTDAASITTAQRLDQHLAHCHNRVDIPALKKRWLSLTDLRAKTS